MTHMRPVDRNLRWPHAVLPSQIYSLPLPASPADRTFASVSSLKGDNNTRLPSAEGGAARGAPTAAEPGTVQAVQRGAPSQP